MATSYLCLSIRAADLHFMIPIHFQVGNHVNQLCYCCLAAAALASNEDNDDDVY